MKRVCLEGGGRAQHSSLHTLIIVRRAPDGLKIDAEGVFWPSVAAGGVDVIDHERQAVAFPRHRRHDTRLRIRQGGRGLTAATWDRLTLSARR